jgi:hypothetical protein
MAAASPETILQAGVTVSFFLVSSAPAPSIHSTMTVPIFRNPSHCMAGAWLVRGG